MPRFAAASVGAAVPALRQYGAVVIDDAFAPATIDDLREAILARQPELADRSLLIDCKDSGADRWIAPVVISRAVYDSGILQSAVVAAIATAALGDDWVIEAFGMVMASPGCADQHVHRDGNSLYPETPLSAMLPAYALTIAIPLVDVPSGSGTTSFRLGSNLYDNRYELADLVSAGSTRGALLAWDFEVLHRGDANGSGRARPMLYLTVCRPFWTDMSNFGGTARVKLVVDPDVVPLLDRRFARAAEGEWAHRGLGDRLAPIDGARSATGEPCAAAGAAASPAATTPFP